tara:strand:- start:4333 stop:4677 length:345 start_codon:yes stop_codon:yes gene_type:complete
MALPTKVVDDNAIVAVRAIPRRLNSCPFIESLTGRARKIATTKHKIRPAKLSCLVQREFEMSTPLGLMTKRKYNGNTIAVTLATIMIGKKSESSLKTFTNHTFERYFYLIIMPL